MTKEPTLAALGVSAPTAVAPAVATPDWTTAEALRQKETAVARLKQLEYDQKAGRLLPVDDVEREWSSILGGVRSRMLAVSSRCGSRLPHLTPHDVAEIDREIRDGLTELGSDNA